MFQFPANPLIGQQFAPAVGVTYEWNGTGWVFLGMSTASLYPPGIVLPFAGVVTPLPFQGWLPCDGNVYAVANYPALFAVIGGQYGGNGTSTFAVPDLRGRVLAGLDNMGTPTGAASRLTAPTFPGGGTLGGAGGAQNVGISVAELAAHTHSIPDPGHYHNVSDPTHAHGVSDPSHAHGVADPSHTHTLSGSGQRALVLDADSFPLGDVSFRSAGSEYVSFILSGSVAPASTGIGIYGNYTGIAVNGAGTGIGIIANGTGINATNVAGSGGGHANIQPTVVMNYIIKV